MRTTLIKLILSAGLVMLCILPQACHKTTLVVPDACVAVDKTEVKPMESVTFTDCCEAAENVQLLIYKSWLPTPSPNNYVIFDEHRQYKKAFSDTGTYTALVRAINNSVPIQEFSVQVTVKN